MAKGPGKYDDLCTLVREQAEAKGAIVIVLGGNKGFGFAVQLEPGIAVKLPELLRDMADQIEGEC